MGQADRLLGVGDLQTPRDNGANDRCRGTGGHQERRVVPRQSEPEKKEHDCQADPAHGITLPIPPLVDPVGSIALHTK